MGAKETLCQIIAYSLPVEEYHKNALDGVVSNGCYNYTVDG